MGNQSVLAERSPDPRVGARAASSRCAPYPQLHPGPGLSHDEVASHQRARIYAAMIELVAECGYGAVTVLELARLAGVSKHTVYEHFPGGKQECFRCTYDLIAWRACKRVGAAQKDCRDWRERLHLAFSAWAGEIAREPKAAHLALVEAFTAGPAALERMRHAEGLFETMIEQSFASAPDAIVVSPLIVKGIVAGVHRVARARLLAGCAHELPGLADELLEWMLCFHCQEATALARLDDPPSLHLAAPESHAVSGGPAPGDDRARILEAVARLAFEEGYGELTAPRIRSAAGVSRKRFDQHFEDVQGCFIAALEHLTDRALAQVAPVGAAAHTWPGGLHRALGALCAHIAADPVFARLAFIEVFAPGADGMLCRARVITDVAESLRMSAPAGQRPSELAAEASVGAVWGIVHRHVASGRAYQLPSVTAVLSFLALAPAVSGQHAVEAITAEHEVMRKVPTGATGICSGVRGQENRCRGV